MAALSVACGQASPAAPTAPNAMAQTGLVTSDGQPPVVGEPIVEVQPVKSSMPCVYSVEPVETVRHWHHTSGEIAVSATADCDWVVGASGDWLTVTSVAQGSGPGAITFATSTYSGEGSRRTAIVVRWPSTEDKQNAWVTQEGCSYTMSAPSQGIAVEGSRASVSVFGNPVSLTCSTPCPWTATSQSKWIHLVSPPSFSGVGDVTYDVDENTTGEARVGSIKIEGMTFYIKQNGA